MTHQKPSTSGSLIFAQRRLSLLREAVGKQISAFCEGDGPTPLPCFPASSWKIDALKCPRTRFPYPVRVNYQVFGTRKNFGSCFAIS
jgi:hypothetical protein